MISEHDCRVAAMSVDIFAPETSFLHAIISMPVICKPGSLDVPEVYYLASSHAAAGRASACLGHSVP